MIQQAETLIKYGYLAMDLPPQSQKLILAACDNCGKVRDIRNDAYHPLCNSCARKGNTYALGHTLTEEHKANISIANTEKIHTKEQKAKQSAAMKGKTGDKTPNWQGGISFEPYCVKFNNAFKEYIRAKFGHTCFLCPITQAENGKKLAVHHVNYNKSCGCDGDKTCQFVPLCMSCHMKTNGNRDYWQKLITDKLHCLIIGWRV